MMGPQVEVPTCSGWNWVTTEDPGGLHGGQFPYGGVLLRVNKQGEDFGREEDVV